MYVYFYILLGHILALPVLDYDIFLFLPSWIICSSISAGHLDMKPNT